MNRSPFKAGGLAAALLASVALAGCTVEPAAQPSETGGTCPVTADEDFTGTVRLAYQQIPNADLIVKANGLLEACLPNATISWKQFSSGGDVVQAFAAGSLDMGLAGSSPSTKAVSAPLDLPVQIVWAHDIIGTAESLVVHDPDITSITGLKGKSIAVPFGSTSHFSLLQALEQAGMTDSDVDLINLAPEKMPAAWMGDQVDAAWVWDPVLTQLKDDGGTTIMSSADTADAGAPTFDMEIASTEFIDANPDVLETWTAVENYAVGMIASDPDVAAEAIASELGVTTDEVVAQFPGYTYPTAQVQSTLFHDQLPDVLVSTATFLKSQGGVDEAKSDYTSAICTTAIDAVSSEG